MTVGLFTAGPAGGAPPLPTRQEIVDRIQAEARKAALANSQPRPLFRPPPERPAALLPTQDAVSIRIAQEVAYLRRQLDALGDALCMDAAVTARHAGTMQQFDIIGQALGHIAVVLETDDREEAIKRVGMDDLRARLTRRAL